jgi:electron transport complex protein RnfA
MGELLLIALGAALVNNLALTELLGASAMLRASRGVDAALALGLATGITLLLGTGLAVGVERAVLDRAELPHLRLPASVAAVTAAGWLVHSLLLRAAPQLRELLPRPLLGVNVAVLGVALIAAAAGRGLVATLVHALGAAVGFTLALALFAGLREHLLRSDVPYAFRGAPILLVTAGLLSLAFMAFAGFARL